VQHLLLPTARCYAEHGIVSASFLFYCLAVRDVDVLWLQCCPWIGFIHGLDWIGFGRKSPTTVCNIILYELTMYKASHVSSVTTVVPGQDSENFFGRGTLDLSRRRRWSDTPKALRGRCLGREFTQSPADWELWGRAVSSSAGSGSEPQPLMIFEHYKRNFVRFYACFSAFWNLADKANKTDPIRPLMPAIGLEGARASCSRDNRPSRPVSYTIDCSSPCAGNFCQFSTVRVWLLVSWQNRDWCEFAVGFDSWVNRSTEMGN